MNPGLGANLAYEGIARLTNSLVPSLKEYPIPSFEKLELSAGQERYRNGCLIQQEAGYLEGCPGGSG